MESAGSSGDCLYVDIDDVVIVGAGMGAPVLENHYDRPEQLDTFIQMNGEGGARIENVGIRDLAIENVEGFGTDTIHIDRVNKAWVRDLRIDNTDNPDSPGLPIACGKDGGAISNEDMSVTGCITDNDLHGNKSIEMAGIENAVMANNTVRCVDGQGCAFISVDGGVDDWQRCTDPVN